MTTARENTKIYLNTWGAYNNGSIGYGWMTPAEAREFINKNPERDGGEWFIADIDNYLGVDFGSLEYANVNDIIDAIETLEGLDEYEIDEIVALMEYKSTNNVQEAIEDRDSYTFYSDIDEYHNVCDDSLDFEGNELLE